MIALWNRLRAAGTRIKGAWRGYAAFGVLAVTLCWAFLVPWPICDAELRLSIAGMLLQLMGVGTVAAGIRATRKLLKKPPILGGIWNHLAGLFREPRNLSLIAELGQMRMAGDAVSATVTKAQLTTSLEDRVKRLEEELNAHAGRLTELRSQISAEASARERAIGDEQNARLAADHELRQVLDDVQTGGVVLTVAGLVWLVFGIILTSIPQLLARIAVVG